MLYKILTILFHLLPKKILTILSLTLILTVEREEVKKNNNEKRYSVNLCTQTLLKKVVTTLTFSFVYGHALIISLKKCYL